MNFFVDFHCLSLAEGWSGLRDSGRLQMGLHLSHPSDGEEASLQWARTDATSWCLAKQRGAMEIHRETLDKAVVSCMGIADQLGALHRTQRAVEH